MSRCATRSGALRRPRVVATPAATRAPRPRRSLRRSRPVAPALVLVFAAEGALLAPLTGRLREAFGPGCRVLGCSSAGNFAFGRYRDDRVVAIAFPAAGFRAAAVWLRDLRQHMALDWIRTLRRLSAGFDAGGAGLVALRAADDRRALPPRGGGRRHRGRGARRPAGARRLGRRRAALRADAPRARRRELPRERDLLPRRQRLSGRGGDLRPLHPGEQPHGGDRGAARGAGDPLDQRRAGGGGVCPADRRWTRRRSVRAPSPRTRC